MPWALSQVSLSMPPRLSSSSHSRAFFLVRWTSSARGHSSHNILGVLTILAVSAVFLLLSVPYLDVHSRRIDSTLRNSRRRASSNTPIKIPLLSTIVLYASTTVYMAGLIWNWTSVARIIAEANDGLLSDGYDGRASLLALENAVLKQSWMATIALGVNVSFPL